MEPLEPLPSHQPVPPTPVPARLPAAGRNATSPATSGRQPATGPARKPEGAPVRPLQASFRFEELARQVVITLVDTRTNEVVQQIPPEKVLKLISYFQQRAASAADNKA